MFRCAIVRNLVLAIFLLFIIASAGMCVTQKVLIVTTASSYIYPGHAVTSEHSGEYVATDLVAAGIPFDIRTYQRFVAMTSELANYDVIILNGYTQPVSASDVVAQCLLARQNYSAKIFINGYMPFIQYASDGVTKLPYGTETFYAAQLFGVTRVPNKPIASTSPLLSVPSIIEKDPAITAYGAPGAWINLFNITNPEDAPVQITAVCGSNFIRYVAGFVGPKGGCIDGATGYLLNLLDYGKLVNYLRYGDSTIIGFANDRIDGKPIVSWEVHGDTTDDAVAVDGLVALANKYNIPLDCLLVYNRLYNSSHTAVNQSIVNKWNSANSPYIAIGSHSRSHPAEWPPVDALYESTQALNDQRMLIPTTTNYFNFSGNMNPTSTQIDQISQSGTLFGATSMLMRYCAVPTSVAASGRVPIQIEAIGSGWLRALAECQYTPTLPSHTLNSDYNCYSDTIETGDGANQLSSWSIFGTTSANCTYDAANYRNILYWELTNSGDPYTGARIVKLYKDATKSTMVASGLRFGNGLMSINGSGISASVTVNYVSNNTTSGNSISIGKDFYTDTQQNFLRNIKYGMYSFGYIHDYTQDNARGYAFNGEYYSSVIDRTMKWLYDQDVCFVYTHDLVNRLQDYIAGNISYTTNTDGSSTITVDRPNALINEIKIAIKGDYIPSASGDSVISQRLAKRFLYVRLKPETSSTIQVVWAYSPPPVPTVVYSSPYVSNASQAQLSAIAPDSQLEFQFAVGTAVGSTDSQDWTNIGTSTTATLSSAHLEQGQTYYISSKCRRIGGTWSDPGATGPTVADLTPPVRSPRVDDDGVLQFDITSLHASWTADDPESGIAEYLYAIGTHPGASDVVAWTATTATEKLVNNLHLTLGNTYYFSVRARNGAELWSETGTSNGILVTNVSDASIAEARTFGDSSQVHLSGNSVSAVFTDEFYIESPDRSAGIRVLTSKTVNEGDITDITGLVSQGTTGTTITDANVGVSGSSQVKPLFMLNKMVGGMSAGLIIGPTGGVGLNNVGLLVTTSGCVTDNMQPGCIYINDGSLVSGIKVTCSNPSSYSVGTKILATGISSLEVNGSKLNSYIRTSKPADIIAY